MIIKRKRTGKIPDIKIAHFYFSAYVDNTTVIANVRFKDLYEIRKKYLPICKNVNTINSVYRYSSL